MKTALLTALFSVLQAAAFVSLAQAADDPGNEDEIQLLREEIEHIRTEYENRIAELERRLDAAEEGENQAVQDAPAAETQPEYAAVPAAPPPVTTTTSSGRDNSFNPAIGVTLQGQAWSYGKDPESYYIPGFPLGGEAGLAPEGLSLAESEIVMSANVDDKFTAMLTVPVVIEDGETVVELEEAWVETTALPAGFALRLGRFYSDVGYLNTKHSHAWDFADQPLA
ncbi:MAG TPA: hypothetical protein VI566_08880, partial [Xanthomonadales bacterium]|nr:hypothetical protein [Xanthomonadales bacterium]